MAQNIDDMRTHIDDIDRQIHDLILQRSKYVKDIGAYKREHNLDICVPSREAQLIRKLSENHKGALNLHTLIQVWRELIAGFTLIQKDMRVAIALDADTQSHKYHLFDHARDYFGSAFPMIEAKDSQNAINLLRENKVDFAVVPMAENATDQSYPWWMHFNEDLDQPARILVKLPFQPHLNSEKNDYKALVLGLVEFKSSGDDNSFIFLDLDQQISRGRIIDLAKEHDISVISLATNQKYNDQRSYHLVEVTGYLDADHSSFTQFVDAFNDPQIKAYIAGGYPVLHKDS